MFRRLLLWSSPGSSCAQAAAAVGSAERLLYPAGGLQITPTAGTNWRRGCIPKSGESPFPLTPHHPVAFRPGVCQTHRSKHRRARSHTESCRGQIISDHPLKKHAWCASHLTPSPACAALAPFPLNEQAACAVPALKTPAPRLYIKSRSASSELMRCSWCHRCKPPARKGAEGGRGLLLTRQSQPCSSRTSPRAR